MVQDRMPIWMPGTVIVYTVNLIYGLTYSTHQGTNPAIMFQSAVGND